MTREKLKELGVNDEILESVFNAVEEEINTSVNSAVTEAVKNAENSGSDDELKKARDEIEGLKGQIDTLTSERDDFKLQLGEKEKSYAAEKLFDGYKFSSALAREAALAKFKAAELEFSDGGFVGGKEWLEDLKKAEPTAFGTDVPVPKLMTGTAGAGKESDADARAVMGL